MDRYADAKARLFNWPGLEWAVLNVDDAFGQRLEGETRPARVAGYGFERGAVMGKKLHLSQAGLPSCGAYRLGQCRDRCAAAGRFQRHQRAGGADHLAGFGRQPG